MDFDHQVMKQRALTLCEEAQMSQLDGDLDHAIELYVSSIDLCPTAEAHTFLGWAYSEQGQIEDAIAECKLAIETDPTFGNPYNDIGSYLINLGQLDEAVEWLEQAKNAPRYDARHYPYMNMGRIFAEKGQVLWAIREYEKALMMSPQDPGSVQALEALRVNVN